MGFCVVVNLLNPLIMESAVDDYISKGNFRGWDGLSFLQSF